MANSIQSIALDKLLAHPDNPNQMSRGSLAKLIRNIERTGRYEPLVVRPHPTENDYFQIINGHHRCRALAELDYKAADAIVWDIDDEQTDILLSTLNRLSGTDDLGRKLILLKRLNKKIQSFELAKLLPQTARQIEQLTHLKRPTAALPDGIAETCFANPMVFFVNDTQKQTIENALSLAPEHQEAKTKAAKAAAALVYILQYFLNNQNHNQSK